MPNPIATLLIHTRTLFFAGIIVLAFWIESELAIQRILGFDNGRSSAEQPGPAVIAHPLQAVEPDNNSLPKSGALGTDISATDDFLRVHVTLGGYAGVSNEPGKLHLYHPAGIAAASYYTPDTGLSLRNNISPALLGTLPIPKPRSIQDTITYPEWDYTLPEAVFNPQPLTVNYHPLDAATSAPALAAGEDTNSSQAANALVTPALVSPSLVTPAKSPYGKFAAIVPVNDDSGGEMQDALAPQLDFASPPAAIPEPSTWGLLAAGAAMLFALRRMGLAL